MLQQIVISLYTIFGMNDCIKEINAINMNTGMDDQLARCNIAVEEGWGIVVEERNEKTIAEGVNMLLEKTRDQQNEFEASGAWILAEKILARCEGLSKTKK